MIYFIRNKWVSIVSALILVILLGVFPSIYFNEWGYFGRSGALVIIFAAFLLSMDLNILRDMKKLIFDIGKHPEFPVKDKELNDKLVEFLESEIEKNKEDNTKLDFLLIIIGTLIWAYGDLINLI